MLCNRTRKMNGPLLDQLGASYKDLGTRHARVVAISQNRTCVLSRFSHIQLFETLWTVAHQAPLSMGILQARILEWVAMPSSRGSSQPRD